MTPERVVLAARLVSYLGDREQAIAVLGDGLAEHPQDARLLYQRGVMRLITRALPEALADLQAAVDSPIGGESPEAYREQVVADVLGLVLEREQGQVPAATGGTVRVGARLHLGLTRYLLGEYGAAAEDFALTRAEAAEPYQYLAALDWEHLSRHRNGEPEAAQRLIDELDWADHPLGASASTTSRSLETCYVQRLRLYRNEAQPEDLLRATSVQGIHVATLGYGVGAWYRYRGYESAAARTFARILEVGDPTTVGYLAAEAEAARDAHPDS